MAAPFRTDWRLISLMPAIAQQVLERWGSSLSGSEKNFARLETWGIL